VSIHAVIKWRTAVYESVPCLLALASMGPFLRQLEVAIAAHMSRACAAESPLTSFQWICTCHNHCIVHVAGGVVSVFIILLPCLTLVCTEDDVSGAVETINGAVEFSNDTDHTREPFPGLTICSIVCHAIAIAQKTTEGIARSLIHKQTHTCRCVNFSTALSHRVWQRSREQGTFLESQLSFLGAGERGRKAGQSPFITDSRCRAPIPRETAFHSARKFCPSDG